MLTGPHQPFTAPVNGSNPRANQTASRIDVRPKLRWGVADRVRETTGGTARQRRVAPARREDPVPCQTEPPGSVVAAARALLKHGASQSPVGDRCRDVSPSHATASGGQLDSLAATDAAGYRSDS